MPKKVNKAARVRFGVFITCLAWVATLAHAEPGSIGFSLAVSVDGFFSPTVARAEISAVKPDSPAAVAGLRPGDLITQIDDCKIPGCPGSKAKELLAKEAGQVLKLKVLRDGAEQEFIVHVAAKLK